MLQLKKIVLTMATACWFCSVANCATPDVVILTSSNITDANSAETFPPVMPPKMNKKALKQLVGEMSPSYNDPIMPKREADNEVSIMGEYLLIC